MKFRNRAAMPSRPLCLISFLSLEDVLLDCQHTTKLTQPAKNCRIYFNKVKLSLRDKAVDGNDWDNLAYYHGMLDKHFRRFSLLYPILSGLCKLPINRHLQPFVVISCYLVLAQKMQTSIISGQQICRFIEKQLKNNCCAVSVTCQVFPVRHDCGGCRLIPAQYKCTCSQNINLPRSSCCAPHVGAGLLHGGRGTSMFV